MTAIDEVCLAYDTRRNRHDASRNFANFIIKNELNMDRC